MFAQDVKKSSTPPTNTSPRDSITNLLPPDVKLSSASTTSGVSLTRPLAKDPRRSFAITANYMKRDNVDETLSTKELMASDPNQTIDDNINLLSQIETTKNILCCKFTEDHEQLAAGFVDGIVRLFNRETGINTFVLHDAESRTDATVTSIKHRPPSKNYPPSNTLLVSYTNGCIKCWDYLTGRCLYTIRENRQTLALAYHPRLPKFVTTGDDGKVFLYDEETKQQERSFIPSDDKKLCDGHTSRVFAACFNPRSQFEVVTGGWDDTVQFWDSRVAHSVRHIQGVHICAEGVDIHQTGRTVLTSAWQKNNPFQLWDYTNLKLIQSIKPDPYNSMLYCGRWLDNNYAVCGGCEPNLIRLVDMRTFMSVGSVKGLPGGVYSFDVGPQRKNKRARGPKSEVSNLPVVGLVAGKRIIQLDFC